MKPGSTGRSSASPVQPKMPETSARLGTTSPSHWPGWRRFYVGLQGRVEDISSLSDIVG